MKVFGTKKNLLLQGLENRINEGIKFWLGLWLCKSTTPRQHFTFSFPLPASSCIVSSWVCERQLYVIDFRIFLHSRRVIIATEYRFIISLWIILVWYWSTRNNPLAHRIRNVECPFHRLAVALESSSLWYQRGQLPACRALPLHIWFKVGYSIFGVFQPLDYWLLRVDLPYFLGFHWDALPERYPDAGPCLILIIILFLILIILRLPSNSLF